MNCSAELRQLAHLLRAGTDIAREAAELQLCGAADIARLAAEALGIANRLDGIAAGCPRAEEGDAGG